MNRQEFMNQLAAELSRLPKEEIQAAMEYYSEYFDEAGPGREQETIAELGSPAKVATQIKADYAVRQLDEPGAARSARKGLSAILWVILGIFAAPVALPVAIALGAIAFAMFIAIAAIIFSLLVSFGAVCISGIGLVFIGFAGLSGSLAGGIMLIGMGLVSAGITALLCVGVAIGAKALIHAAVRWIQQRNMRRMARKGRM